MGKSLSDIAKEPPKLWLERINAFKRTADAAIEERKCYSLALSLRYKTDPAFDNLDPETKARVRESTHDTPMLFRYSEWLKSQAAGDKPLIEYPADDGMPPEFSEFASKLLTKVIVDETGAMKEWADGMTRLASFGSEAFWYGFHAEAVGVEEAKNAGESKVDVVEAMKQGDTAPKPGQDHQMLAEIAGEQATSDDAVEGMDFDTNAAVMEGAVAQRVQALDEEESIQPVSVTARRIWCRRAPIGLKTFWSGDVSHDDDIWWMARKFFLPVAVAQDTVAFDKKTRETLVGQDMKSEDGFSPVELAGIPSHDAENRRVAIYEIWDKRTRTRHFVSDECEFYLEASESNPYVDEDGRPVVPGFFPCVVSRPLEPDDETPSRLLGLPLIAPGWDQQREYNELRGLSIAAVRKHSIRQYQVHSSASPASVNVLTSGEDGAAIQDDAVPPGDDIVKPINFTNPPKDLDQQASMIKGDISLSLAWPMAAMLGHPVASTATQEQLGVAAGQSQSEHTIMKIERDFARGVEIVRGLIRGFYPPEKIEALVGSQHAEILEGWRGSSLDGDFLTVKFGARAKAENAVQIKQKFQLWEFLGADLDPVMQVPRWDRSALTKSIARDLGEAEPRLLDPELKQLMALAQEAIAARQLESEAQQGEERRQAREAAKEPSNANENSAARRTGDL